MLNKLKFLLKDEHGQTLVLFAVSLVALLGFTAIVTDVGYMYYQKSTLQTAADAAALGGALAAPKSNDSQVSTTVNDLADSNLKDPYDIKPPTIDRSEGTVKVEITQEVPKFFAKVITSDTYSITVTAKAKFSTLWDGEALPFINLVDKYEINKQFEVWNKVDSGQFGSLWKDDFDTFYPNIHSKTYFKIYYKDGITSTHGKVATVKQEVGNVVSQNHSVYLFSLSNKAIDEKKYTDIKNKQVISYNDLVLLKLKVESYDYKILEVKVEEIYDIVNNVFPEDSFNSDAKPTSKLVD